MKNGRHLYEANIWVEAAMAQGEDTKIHQPNGLARVAAALDGPGDYRQINQKLSQPQERSWREVFMSITSVLAVCLLRKMNL